MTPFETLRDLLLRDRSIRRFDGGIPVSDSMLRSLIELTRFCHSGRNLQPLRYKIVNDPEKCAEIFPALKWAGYYEDWDGPAENERPTAYIIQCLDTTLTTNPLCDEGLQLEAISLGATSAGLGGCIIKAFDKQLIAESLQIPHNLDIRYVYALGVPAEKTRITVLEPGGDYRYFRDENDVQCVPKLDVKNLII